MSYSITDVQILVVDTGEFVGCGAILARTSCSTTFPLRTYRGNSVLLTWQEQQSPHSTDTFTISVPDHIDRTRSAWMEMVVFAPGQAGAKLVQ